MSPVDLSRRSGKTLALLISIIHYDVTKRGGSGLDWTFDFSFSTLHCAYEVASRCARCGGVLHGLLRYDPSADEVMGLFSADLASLVDHVVAHEGRHAKSDGPESGPV